MLPLDKKMRLTAVQPAAYGKKLRLMPKISLYGKKLDLRPKLTKEHAEALRERLQQPNEPAGN